MPRRSKKNARVIQHVLSQLEEGTPLAAILRNGEAEGLPCQTTWNDWVRADETLALAYERAREAGEFVIAAESLAIIDEPPRTFVTESGAIRVDPADVQHKRVRAEHRLKLLKVWNPSRWGDKVDVQHGGTLNVTIDADVAGIG